MRRLYSLLDLTLVLWSLGPGAGARSTRQSAQGQLGLENKQRAFNELVHGADALYTEFENVAVSVNQMRSAFLLCASCPYKGPRLNAEGFHEMFGIDHLVDRRFIVESIFPALKQILTAPSYLWIGVKPYTTRYEYIVREDGASRWDTIEIDPSTAVYGSSQWHCVDKAQNIDKHVKAGTYDVIIGNGVLGWGIDSPSEIAEFFRVQARVLKPNGYLIIGYNPHIGSGHTVGIEEYFRKVSIGDIPQKVSFDIEWKHNYEFYQKF